MFGRRDRKVPATSAAADWAAGLFGAPLVALAGAPGVWAIRDDRTDAAISDQFKGDAATYHARYAASDHFERLFRRALEATEIAVAAQPLILDLGSGSGVNSILPCFNIFPGARQVATDLSGELLTMLAAEASAQGLAERLRCVVMDAMGDQMAAGRFDLVTGASILHHLTEPERGLRAAARALKPGGQAIFMEPFDGFGLVRLAYERILAEAELRGEALEPAVERALQVLIVDIAGRTDADPTRPGFAELDDKWLFSRESIERMARTSGFEAVRFVAQNDKPHLYRAMAGVQIRLATGADDLTLPDWAWEILDSFDRALPPAVKRLLMLEGTIVLTKAG